MRLMTGQVGAIRLGISKALQNWEPDLRPALKNGTISKSRLSFFLGPQNSIICFIGKYQIFTNYRRCIKMACLVRSGHSGLNSIIN
jgi:hypothetical protein